MFKKAVESAVRGDRIGMCVTQFEANLLERGLACYPNTTPLIYAAIIPFNHVPYFKTTIRSKSRFHVSIGHETVMGNVRFFSQYPPFSEGFNSQGEYEHMDDINISEEKAKRIFALIEFEEPVPCPKNAFVIASKLDLDIHSNVCRLAFHGKVIEGITVKDYKETYLPTLKVYKFKQRKGTVDRVTDESTLIGKDLFSKETRLDKFISLSVSISTGEVGVIESGFGQGGKFKVRLRS